jgi:hypothetical protein
VACERNSSGLIVSCFFVAGRIVTGKERMCVISCCSVTTSPFQNWLWLVCTVCSPRKWRSFRIFFDVPLILRRVAAVLSNAAAVANEKVRQKEKKF